MKKLLIAIITITLVTILTGCEPMPPIMDERCVNYEDYSFYQIEKETAFGTKDQWILETAHGKIEVSDKVYDGAMAYEYSEICYTRADGVAVDYSYTRKSTDIKPEPEVVIEYVDVPVEVPVYITTFNTLEDPSAIFATPEGTAGVIYLDNESAWLILGVTSENRTWLTEDELPIEQTLDNFLPGDLIILTVIYQSHMLQDDEVWKASITQYRKGIPIMMHTNEELYVIVSTNSIEDFMQNYLDDYPNDMITDLKDAYALLYPEVE